MTKALFLIVPDGFRDEEYSIPKEIFEKNGIEVITGSTVKGPLTGKKGLTTASVDILLDDVNSSDYACILIVGGQKTFWHNEKLISLIKEMSKQNKIIAAICISGVIPAQAGLMQGKRGTAFETPESLAEMKKYGVIYKGNPVEVDGNIVTANGPAAAKDFANEAVKLIKNID